MSISVSGGVDGIAANRDEMRALAGLLDRGAGDLDELCALLAQVDFALTFDSSLEHHRLEARDLRDALERAQSHRLGPGALRHTLREHAQFLRFAAHLYGQHEHTLLSAIGSAWRSAVRLERSNIAASATLLRTGSPTAAAGSFATHDPGLVDDLADGVLIPIDEITARIPDDGHPAVRDLDVDTDLTAATPPANLVAAMGELEDRDGDADKSPGEIDVRIMTGPDGRRHVIVDITGTEDWSPIPGRDVADLTSDERALLGLPTSYAKGVEEAMRRAGVRPTDQVMVMGHSLGGMIAVEVAADAAKNHQFDVTDVVTAGSPIARTVGRLPTKVEVLALENDDDIVPHADGAANPDRPNITTVTFHAGDYELGDDHGMESYLSGADQTEVSTDPSVLAWENRAKGFFDETSAVTHAYQVSRA